MGFFIALHFPLDMQLENISTIIVIVVIGIECVEQLKKLEEEFNLSSNRGLKLSNSRPLHNERFPIS